MNDYMDDYMNDYHEHWKKIVERPDGTLNLDQVARELADYGNLRDWVTKAYDGVTFGAVSEPNTSPSFVISVVNARIDTAYREAIEDLIQDLENTTGRAFTSTAEVVALIRELTVP